MYEDEYIKEIKMREKTEEEKEIDLIISIIKARKELDEANKNFEYANGDLIDYYTYKIKATRAKIDYLIKKAKEKGLAMGMIDQIDLTYNKVI